jgi:hypothetical protein
MSGSKISIVLAATALLVSVLFATPLGQAAGRMILPKNSVGAAQLKKNAVGSKKIAKNAVTSAKVKDASLLAADFKAGQLPAGPKGDTGPRGLQGIQGVKGDKGDPGISGLEYVVVSSAYDSNSPKYAYAQCPAGKYVIGSGAATAAGSLPVAVADVEPLSGTVVARAFETSATAANWEVTAYAVCAKVG